MTDLTGMITEYTKPELVVLVPVLYIISVILEKSKVSSVIIPYVVGGVSILLAGIYTIANAPSYSVSTVLLSIFISITQGVLYAGASLYIDNIAVKIPKSCRTCVKHEDETAEEIKKSDNE